MYMINLASWLDDHKDTITRYCSAQEKSTGGSEHHMHTVVEFNKEYATGNKSWRDALLRETNPKDPKRALVIKHELTYHEYLGYVCKENNIVGRLETTDEDVAAAVADYKINVDKKWFKDLLKSTRVIPPTHLDMMIQAVRYRTGTYDNAECMQYLIDMGFVCIDKQFNGDYSRYFEKAT